MSDDRLAGFDFFQEIDFGPLEPDTEVLDIPDEHIPPDPDDADCLPSQMHTSYPYGNPTKLSHPAALGTYPFGLGDAHLYAQLSYDASAQRAPSSLRWDDEGLDELLPVDPRKVEAERAARARKGATGAAQNSSAGPPPPPPPPPPDGEPADPAAEPAGEGDTTGNTAMSDVDDDDDAGIEESF